MTVMDEYCELIEKFLERKISAKQFESQYLDIFYEKDEPRSEEVFKIIEKLFFDVDAYTDLPIEPEDDPLFNIDEDELRKRASKALEDLRAVK